jgi:hypothetical protein
MPVDFIEGIVERDKAMGCEDLLREARTRIKKGDI